MLRMFQLDGVERCSFSTLAESVLWGLWGMGVGCWDGIRSGVAVFWRENACHVFEALSQFPAHFTRFAVSQSQLRGSD